MRRTRDGVASALVALAFGLLLLAWTSSAAAAGAVVGSSASRGIAVTEQRIALVIGNAAYRVDPLDNPVHDARLVAQSLKQAGFDVTLREDLDRRSLVDALRTFGNRLNENTIALLYYAGHGLQLRDHNYMIPVDAEIHNEDEIPLAGLDLEFILNRMSTAHSRINIVILDACRNNPFVGRAGSRAQGLAQMDAPVGTLLAYATAPGKLAADGSGGNGLYAAQLARHMLTPGLPVEHVFKRVREAVVRDTAKQQVPWESSSLQGEFSFVPGVSVARESAPDVEAEGEIAFWNSIQGSTRADEYRAYLRQYPSGRFAALAQSRLAAFSPSVPPAAPAPAVPSAGGGNAIAAARASNLPHVGDTWRYRVQDQFRFGDLFLTARVDGVSAEGVAETWSTTSDDKLRTLLVPLEPGFTPLPGWTASPPEFAPYLLASGTLTPGRTLADLSRRIEQVVVPLRAQVQGEEDVVVGAGRFRAVKVMLSGRAASRSGGRGSPVASEVSVWYSPQVRRTVKYVVSTRVGSELLESTTFELVEYRLN